MKNELTYHEDIFIGRNRKYYTDENNKYHGLMLIEVDNIKEEKLYNHGKLKHHVKYLNGNIYNVRYSTKKYILNIQYATWWRKMRVYKFKIK